MHEHSLMADLMKKIADLSGTEKVVSVKVTLGALSHMTPEHFAEHFGESSRGTNAAGAKLDITMSDDIHHPNAQDVLLESIEVAA